MEQENTPGPLRRVMKSKWLVWGIALLALILICVSATIAFGFGSFRQNPTPLQHLPVVGDNAPSLLKVVDAGGDIATTDASLPSTAAAAALQTQDTAEPPQSTVPEQQSAALGASLAAGPVTLQAGVSNTVNPLNVNLGL